jgi:nucleoid-associated protein YgaU
MGCVEQAVLEFDEEVRAPWRPRLVPMPDLADQADEAAEATLRPLVARSSHRSSTRVGACRPPAPAVRRSGSAQVSGRARVGDRPGAGIRGGARVRPGRPAPAARLRLTRRARRLAIVLALAAGVALGSWLAPLVNGDGGGSLRLAGESSVVVHAGDTLWSIASSLGGDGDVRAVIDEIQRLNHLDGAVLVPGQVLQLP